MVHSIGYVFACGLIVEVAVCSHECANDVLFDGIFNVFELFFRRTAVAGISGGVLISLGSVCIGIIRLNVVVIIKLGDVRMVLLESVCREPSRKSFSTTLAALSRLPLATGERLRR